jgi:hypothetical protein
MSLYTLRTTDTLPAIQLTAELRMEECTNVALLAWMGTTTVEDVIKRMANDHVAFVAYINNVPAAFGWMARGKALIGELAHELILPVEFQNNGSVSWAGYLSCFAALHHSV